MGNVCRSLYPSVYQKNKGFSSFKQIKLPASDLPNFINDKRIRLKGIDCPEKGHAYGKRAKQAASTPPAAHRMSIPFLSPFVYIDSARAGD